MATISKRCLYIMNNHPKLMTSITDKIRGIKEMTENEITLLKSIIEKFKQ